MANEDEVETVARFRRPQRVLAGFSTLAAIAVVVWIGTTLNRPSPEPVVAALVAGDESTFLSSVEIENEAAVYAKLRGRVHGAGKLERLRWRGSRGGSDHVRIRYWAIFEHGTAELTVTWKGESIVDIQID